MTDNLLDRARAEAEGLWELSEADAVRSVSLADWNERVEAANGFILGVKWLLSQLPDREAVARASYEATGEFAWPPSRPGHKELLLTRADAALDLIRNGATDDPEPQPSNGPDYHAEYAAWSRRNGATK